MSTVEQLTVERDAARAELADLRRQLAHMTQWRDSAIVDGNEARAEASKLRRQLDEAQAGRLAEVKRSVHASMALARAEEETATLRRQLAAVPRDDIAQLYDAYAYAVAGADNAEHFPAVGRWLGVL